VIEYIRRLFDRKLAREEYYDIIKQEKFIKIGQKGKNES
jgi:hypothetical protein